MYLIGRNNSRAPDGFVMVEPSPSKALKNLQEMENALLDLLGDFVHKFIPGKRFTEVEQPEIDDIVLFVMKEAERKRNVKYKFGRVIEINVDGRDNKVKVEYHNATEVVRRVAIRSVKDLVLIKGINEIDFNSHEHCLVASLQQKYL